MSRQQSSGFSGRPSAGARRRLRHGRSVTVTVALIVGLAACGGGDDDDAADSTSAPESSAVETTSAADATAAVEITAAHDTTGTEPSDSATDDSPTDGTTTDDTTDATSPDDSKPGTAGPGGTATEPTDGSDGATADAAADATDTSEGDTTDEGASNGSAADVGPTTTGPSCEFEENTSLPLERCDMGPAVAVVQSILQADGYEVGIDGNFGDQTIYAVRAFQEEEGLKVDGIVGVQTWSELGIDEQFGTDANGDGVIAPDELDLTE